MHLFPLFAVAVFAAESVLSPVPEDILLEFASKSVIIVDVPKPSTSFGELLPPETPASSVASESENISPTPTPTPMPTRVTRKKTVTIAALGDSMTDTLGPDLPHLKNILTKTYPGTTFIMKNYGVGASNIDYGIQRITNSYNYLGNAIPSLSSQQPDVVIIESFGYNPYPFDDGALDKHWLALSKAVDTVRAAVPEVKIVIGSTIAPNATVFGDGAPGVAFAQNDKWQRVNVIKKYLENAVNFAKSQHLPLANAFHPSLDSAGNGRLSYINPGDHIHYSDAGRAFFSQKIASAIISNKLLE